MLIWEVATTAVGAVSGILAAAFVILTWRSARNGRSAYEANRLVSKPSIWANLKGDMKQLHLADENRTNQGIALELKTGKLIAQQRLSSQAVDEVIAR